MYDDEEEEWVALFFLISLFSRDKSIFILSIFPIFIFVISYQHFVHSQYPHALDNNSYTINPPFPLPHG